MEDWAKSFDGYRGSEIDGSLVEKARELYGDLCRTQTNPRLLHGDLHHENVLWDRERGWLGIDPKGVIGELEYEICAAMRNPHEFAGQFVPKLVEQRLRRFAAVMPMNQERALAWAFSQAVLAALATRAGRKLEHQTYKQLCGEFHAASAFGFSVAVKLVHQGQRGVLLYTLSPRGAKAVCCVQPENRSWGARPPRVLLDAPRVRPFCVQPLAESAGAFVVLREGAEDGTRGPSSVAALRRVDACAPQLNFHFRVEAFLGRLEKRQIIFPANARSPSDRAPDNPGPR